MGEHAPHLAAVSRCYRSRVWSVALPKSLCKFQDDLYQRRGIEPVPKNHSEPNVWKGALAGLVAGLVASWAMDRFQDVWVSLSSKDSTSDDRSSDRDRESSKLKSNQAEEETQDDATVKAASAISENVFSHKFKAAARADRVMHDRSGDLLFISRQFMTENIFRNGGRGFYCRVVLGFFLRLVAF